MRHLSRCATFDAATWHASFTGILDGATAGAADLDIHPIIAVGDDTAVPLIVTPLPEPPSIAMLAAGIVIIAIARRWRK